MHRIDGRGHHHHRFYISPVGAIDDYEGTSFTAEWLNSVQEELSLLLEAFGVKLDKKNEGQIAALLKMKFSQQESRISDLEKRLENDLIGSKAYYEQQVLALENRLFSALQMRLANQEVRLVEFDQKWSKETAALNEQTQGVKKRLDTQEEKVARLFVVTNNLLTVVQGIKKP